MLMKVTKGKDHGESSNRIRQPLIGEDVLSKTLYGFVGTSTLLQSLSITVSL